MFSVSQESEIATKQYLQREETKIAANYLVHCREKETHDNIMERIKKNESNIDMIESRMERKRTESIIRAYEETSAVKITREFMHQIRWRLKGKKEKLDPVNDEEVLRRYSLLTEENVGKCVKLSFAMLNNLNAFYSTRGVIHESILFLLRLVIAVCISTSAIRSMVPKALYVCHVYLNRFPALKCHRAST